MRGPEELLRGRGGAVPTARAPAVSKRAALAKVWGGGSGGLTAWAGQGAAAWAGGRGASPAAAGAGQAVAARSMGKRGRVDTPTLILKAQKTQGF